MDNTDDLFECFGSDEEEEEEHDNNNDHNDQSSCPQTSTPAPTKDPEQPLSLRDPDCGVCKQLHAEKSLLMHIKNAVSGSSNSSGRSNGNNCSIEADEDTTNDDDGGGDNHDGISKPVPSYELVLATIDDFCEKRAWMMHLGPEKGAIIQNVLREKLDEFFNSGMERSFVCAELGTYCGYGSVQISKTLSEYAKNYCNKDKDDKTTSSSITDADLHLFTVEINPSFAQIAREVVDMSQLSKYVTILQNELMINGSADDVGLLLKEGIQNHYQRNSLEDQGDICIDFLLIDHDKDSYLDDLMRLEQCGLVRKGTVVVADNVIFAQIDDYVKYMKNLDRRGVVKSTTVEALVEYSTADIIHTGNEKDLYRDGIEISNYLKDPAV